MKEVRTRFAPSPTGFLHIGGFRTAIYSWLLARHYGGSFILRIEDTDQSRKVEGAVKYILEGFEWLGIDIDEGPSREELLKVEPDFEDAPDIGGDYGPYVQSLRLELYQQAADKLIASGHAFRCDCTPEMLQAEREKQLANKEFVGYGGRCRDRNVPADKPHVVRFRMPDEINVSIEDAVKGRVSWDSLPMRDPVLLKSDGFPTYHLAVVVDDYNMRISHSMRADEWLPSAPLHVMLYQALGWEMPVFAHLPNVLGKDGKKLSKRHGATSWSVFRDQGYLPEALLNYTALVGWSPGEGEEQEIFSREELIKRFSLEHVNRAGAVFDYDKLTWMNGVYIRNLSMQEFVKRGRPFLEKAGLKVNQERWHMIAPHVQERVKLLPEIVEKVDFLFKDKIERDLSKMFKKGIDRDIAIRIIDEAIIGLSDLKSWSREEIEKLLRDLAVRLELKPGPMFGVIRIAVTGKMVTPPLFESLEALGRGDTLRRLEEARELVKQCVA
ncbi:MAG: glutamate--tRNA ligase [Candidatus Dadabacteria bacterium]|nr:MAG: glutamate--tRNA ligase [Candidatus Dadabacteria bacterium]